MGNPSQRSATGSMDPAYTHEKVGRGFETLARLVGVTLGPVGGAILNRGPISGAERLTDAGIIARRLLALPDRVEDVGAMLLRHAIYRQYESSADGGATTAVLAHALVQEARRALAVGANAMRLRAGIEAGSAAVVAALEAQAVPAAGADQLKGVAVAVAGDEEIAGRLAEMFDLMGADAAVHIQEYAALYTDHEYLDGGRWRARPAARHFLSAGKTEAVLEEPLILVANQELSAVADVAGVLNLAAGPERRPLLIVAPAIKDQALNTLIVNHERGALTIAAAICTDVNPRLTHELEDLAVVTGAAVAAMELGRPPARTPLAALGTARRAILSRDTLTVVGGRGAPAAKTARIGRLRAELRNHTRNDKEYGRLRLRLARLAGGAGILKIGAASETERKARVEAANKAVRVLEGVLAGGLVPGGGVAYLNCKPAVCGLQLPSAEEAWGQQIVAAALSAPFQQIVRNRGEVEPVVAMMKVQDCGPDYGYDALANAFVHMPAAGIMDSLAVVQSAWTTAVSAAIMAITTDVVVLHANGRRPLQIKP